MTEVEWLACDDPDQALAWLGEAINVRKATLYACACCRALHWRFTDPRSWAAVNLAEQFVDQMVEPESLVRAAAEADAAFMVGGMEQQQTNAGKITALTASRLLRPFRKGDFSGAAIRQAALEAAGSVRQGVKGQKPIQAALLRCLVRISFPPSRTQPRLADR